MPEGSLGVAWGSTGGLGRHWRCPWAPWGGPVGPWVGPWGSLGVPVESLEVPGWCLGFLGPPRKPLGLPMGVPRGPYVKI